MKKVFVELELPELDKNDYAHIILKKVVSLEDEKQESWQCIFCQKIIKQKKDEVQKEF